MDFTSFLEIILSNWHLLLLFFCVAFCYASVGFGGGSSYLAILTLTGIAYTQIRATALLCNIVVVAGNVVLFQKEKAIPWKKVLPLTLFSVPFAFMGGAVIITQQFFFILLGGTLLFAASTMWRSKKEGVSAKNTPVFSLQKNASYGGAIGFLSGMVGIGGGIFLAPLLHLTHWDRPKKIAATASFFILVNSFSGLLGQFTNPAFAIDGPFTVLLLVTVFIGGQLGRRFSNRFFTAIQLKKATAILIALVSLRILWKYLF